MARTPSLPPSRWKAVVFCCSRFYSHAISSLTHQNDINITLTQLCREGRLKHAMHILLTTNSDTHSSQRPSTCLQLLQIFIANTVLPQANLLHSLIIRIRLQFDPSANKFLHNRLIHMYAKCGSLADARNVFDCMRERDIFSWNLIISGYQGHGFPREALALFHQMQQTPAVVQPDQFTFPTVLKACAKLGDLRQGLYIHQRLFIRGFLSDVVVVNGMVDVYAKCGSVEKARELFDKMHHADTVSWNAMISGYATNGYVERVSELFDKMPQRNLVSWNAVIAGYAQNGFLEKALETFKEMQLSRVKPNSATFAGILPACATMGALEEGMDIHQKVVENGFSSNVVVVNALIDMYAKCGRIHKARELFDKMQDANTVSWTATIAGYAQNGFPEKALETFKQMQLSCVKPNSVTFASILPACATMGAVEEGMDIHQTIVEDGFSSNVVVVSALISMYAKCGRIHKARELFDKMHDENTVSWTAMIAGYIQNGHSEKALETFKQMQLSGVKPNSATFASILPACATMGAVEEGMDIHRGVVENGFSSNVMVVNALIDMYAKCGRIHKARELLDKMHDANTISWTAMIAGYAQNGFSEKALETFNQMQLSGVKPDSAAFASILPACATMGALEEGMDIHQRVVKNGFASSVVVVSSMIDMYAKCGRIHKAQELFDKMHDTDIVVWTALIAGYVQNGFSEKALGTFKQMQLSGLKLDSATVASIVPACATMGALEEGMNIHQRVVENGISSNVVVVSALIDMYAKCGRIHKARELFDKMHDVDTVSWTAMIGGYAIHGYSEEALELFDLMKLLKTNPDSISFVYVLLACSHTGLVDEGCKYFNSMSDSYCIIPGMNHYTCIVDLLGRAGYLEEALNFVVKMPIKPELRVWMCLLGCCRSRRNVGIGEFVATILFLLEPKYASSYVLLSNIYAEVASWDDVQKVRTLMKDRVIRKTPGCSWIEIDKRVHAFLVGDRSHPQTQEIYGKLEKLSSEMKAAGYFPSTLPVLRDVETDDRELLLCQHSEKLAIAFGLLKTPPGTVIRVVKNLRVCDYCHTAIKFISKIVTRDIVVRDANRFHHFKHGECSCGDYW